MFWKGFNKKKLEDVVEEQKDVEVVEEASPKKSTTKKKTVKKKTVKKK